jgi:hypothetical protein
MSEKKKPITVRELIAQLSALPPDAYVLTEGCDCVGPASGASLGYRANAYYAGKVVILRDDDRSES